MVLNKKAEIVKKKYVEKKFQYRPNTNKDILLLLIC